MSDIVEELRQGALTRDDYRWKAADEIEQNRIDLEEYRRDVERLRAALRDISLMDKRHEHDLFSATRVAQAALEVK